MKWVVTGGHLSPAIAFLQQAKSQGDSVLFIGRGNLESTKLKLREKELVTAMGFEYTTIPLIKYDRFNKWKLIIQLPKLVHSLYLAKTKLNQFNPDAVVAFGSYVAIPVAFAAALSRLPVITHEQTVKAGLANRLIALVATKIALSFESSQAYFPQTKTVLTGPLIQEEFFLSQPEPEWNPSAPRPLIYLTGGSQGSLILNQALLPLVKQLAHSFTLIHQTGQKDRADAKKVYQSLTEAEKDHYLAKPKFPPAEVAWIFKHAAVVIARAGANTVSELMVSGTPAIFIPLKGAQQDEQRHNARLMASKGAALIINQDELTPKTLLAAINQLLVNQSYRQSAAQLAKRHSHAVDLFYAETRKLVQ
jgi:UDP-N-acetylglucosamine--N-acetylmuramyl-(pentapeptide) pyrophosphoryl-undecaprenol N-acetylglucosamine transferase